MEIRTVQRQNIISSFRHAPTLRTLSAFAHDIKISHSVFALPFVATGVLLAKIPTPSLSKMALILLAMVSGRSFAMGMNRFLDRHVDSGNLRTQVRAIPSGTLTASQCLFWSIFFGLIFICTAANLSPLAGWLSLPLLAVLASYSFMKRLSWLTHWYLGACLGLAPIAAQIALVGTVTMETICVAAAVMFWTAGFDLLYSLQDRVFDRSHGLYSVPAVFGHRAAIFASRFSFVAMILFLAFAGWATDRHMFYWIGLISVGFLLFWEHWLVRDAMVDGQSKKINAAFFNVNAIVSIAFYICVLVDVLIYGK